MKRIIIVVISILLASSVVYAGQFGPPEPVAKEGNVSLGPGYSYYSAKWEPDDPGWGSVNVRQNQFYLQLSYCFIKNWEGYMRVGGADAKIRDVFEFDLSQDFKEGLKPFGTIGVKGVFNVSPSFGIGPFFQASLYSNYKDERSIIGTLPYDVYFPEYGITIPAGTYTLSETAKVKKPWDINIGVGLQGKIGGAVIYGGPFLYWTRAKTDYSISVTGPLTEAVSVSTTYEEKNNVGGFAGLRLPLGEGFNFEVEGQLKSKFSFGAALSYSF